MTEIPRIPPSIVESEQTDPGSFCIQIINTTSSLLFFSGEEAPSGQKAKSHGG
jgi:hypothetical protein